MSLAVNSRCLISKGLYENCIRKVSLEHTHCEVFHEKAGRQYRGRKELPLAEHLPRPGSPDPRTRAHQVTRHVITGHLLRAGHCWEPARTSDRDRPAPSSQGRRSKRAVATRCRVGGGPGGCGKPGDSLFSHLASGVAPFVRHPWLRAHLGMSPQDRDRSTEIRLSRKAVGSTRTDTLCVFSPPPLSVPRT